MDFPLRARLNTAACYPFLVATLPPDGLRCPACRRSDTLSLHHRRHRPVRAYRCRHGGSVGNAYTGTPLPQTRRAPIQLVLILRGLCPGTPTAPRARARAGDRPPRLARRHPLQGRAPQAAARAGPVAGPTTAADALFPHAGDKRRSASRPR